MVLVNATSGVRDGLIGRLLTWHDQARLAGRKARADALLMMAWNVSDGARPARAPRRKTWQPPRRLPRPSAEILRLFPALAELSVCEDSWV